MSTAVPDPEAAYYQAVEEFFVSRRGDPLFLSNADWLLIRRWRRAGLPLRVVLRGIADALEGHAHSWGRRQKVGSLAYCAAEVEAARERWERALALGGEEGLDIPRALCGFATALERAQDLGPEAAALVPKIVAELREWALHPGEARGLEAWLGAQEVSLVQAVRRDGGEEGVARLEASVEEELVPYRGRMPERILSQIRKESVTRRLLETHGIPRLSFFHL